MKLSVVATLYRSAPYLREFHRRVSEAARRFAGDDYEIVLVNDGSPDESIDVAVELHRDDPRVKVIDLSRNFGHHPAMWTGLQHAAGDHVFLIDTDLEESPEWLETLHAKMIETSADVVFGVQAVRVGGWVNRVLGKAYYWAYNAFTAVTIPENMMTVRLMTRRYIDGLLTHSESTFVISGLWARTGFKQVPLPLPKGCKPTTSYSLFSRFKLLVNSITSFSEAPLYMVFYLGLALLTSSTLVAAVLIGRWLFFGRMPEGWPSLMVSIWFLGGLTLCCQGVVGIYVARIFQEAKRRPISIIRQIHESDAHEREGAADVHRRIAG